MHFHSRLCCIARAHSPRKHQQIQNLRRHDDIVIAVECNDKQRLLSGLHLTVCESEKEWTKCWAGVRADERKIHSEHYICARKSDISRLHLLDGTYSAAAPTLASC